MICLIVHKQWLTRRHRRLKLFVDDVFSALATSIAVPEQGKMQLDQEPSIESKTPLDELLSGPIGVDLETCLIAHDARIQALLDKEDISWGVQFELARGVTTGRTQSKAKLAN
jgi:hypothetical protein